jgi:two-component sensor histidine kinase
MINIKMILLLFFSTFIYANTLNVSVKKDFYDLLPYSEIYIDKSKSLTVSDIQKENIKFQKNSKKLLGYGYNPNFNVWIKVTLKNNTQQTFHKIVEYDNPLTTNIKFYDPDLDYKVQQEGLFFINQKRKTLHPIFHITLKPNESKTYYINASSDVTTLIIKLNLWETDRFYEKEIKYQLILALFFGGMIILTVYNLFIYFFTKDISYLYYVLYIFGTLFHHSIYTGIANIYLFNQAFSIFVIQYAAIFIAFPIFALGLFTKSFLQVQNYSFQNKILNIFLALIPLSLLVFIFSDIFDSYRNVLPVLLSVYLILLTIYSAFHKNRQAYFILFGWFVIFMAILGMNLSSFGIFNVYKYFPYLIETAFILEAIIFSIALADRIKQLQQEKDDVNEKLIVHQKNEKIKLEIEVDKKTKELKLLLKELNHRVKNNMQTIVSLIRLQADEIVDEKVQEIFLTIQNRINAMSHLHELLYKQDDLSHINAYAYFDIVIEELQDSYENDVNISFDINTELKMEQAIYCGLILNELVTNSFKHAFTNNTGTVSIKLTKKNSFFILIIEDDGIGYDKNISSNSLGLILVKTLAKNQLNGDIDIDSSNGVKVTITWNGDD